MIYPEVLDALENLSTQEKGTILEMIIKWNKGEEVIPSTTLEKFVWATILPKLEENKEGYLSRVETNKRNGLLGGAPKGNKNASKNKTTDGLNETTENNQKQHNYNSNYNSNNNSSKEELLNIEQPSSPPKGDEVVSKGLESLEKTFPQGRNYIGIDEINLWNSLSQEQKKIIIKRATLYIRNEKKKEEGKYIKGVGKWLKEQIENGIEEKQPTMNNSTKSDDPRLLKMVDGNIYSLIMGKVNNSTRSADKLYYLLNKKEMFQNKQELLLFVKELNQQEINDLIN